MHISKSIKWIEPYLDTVRHLLPEMKLLTSIVSRKPKNSIKEIQRINGMCHKYSTGTYKIIVYTHDQSIKKLSPVEIEIVEHSKLEFLRILSHELSHLRYWDHTPSRFILECKIMAIFMKQAIREGYISDENPDT